MTRPLRIEFAGALYHVTARGDRLANIFRDDTDRFIWIEALANVCERYNFIIHAFCQMTNHYHLLVETVDGGLSRGMRQLNGIYSQRFNRRHELVGHVLQGRYHAILVQKEEHLLELSRYLVLNPVRAGMVRSPVDWPWSSYRNCMQDEAHPAWLATDWLLGQFGADRTNARLAYQDFVFRGRGMLSPLRNVRHQILLGDAGFIARYRGAVAPEALDEIVRVQRRAVALSLQEYAQQDCLADEAMARAFRSMAYSMQEIADHFNTSVRSVGRAVRKYDA